MQLASTGLAIHRLLSPPVVVVVVFVVAVVCLVVVVLVVGVKLMALIAVTLSRDMAGDMCEGETVKVVQ